MMSVFSMRSWRSRASCQWPFSNTTTGVPSIRRPKRGDRVFPQDTKRCIRPIVEIALIAATMEWSSPSTAVMLEPASMKSTIRSNGASWLVERRPISRNATRRIQ